MARQKGVFRFTGTIDGVTYYESKYGPLVRKKGGTTADQIRNDPSFERVRENGKEFGTCSKATKLLRGSLGTMLREASDFLVTGRLNKMMIAIKNLDTLSIRGERNVATGILSPAAKDLVKDFNFNERAPLFRVFKKALNLNITTGIINVPGLVAEDDLGFPPGATHAKVTGAWLRIDFGAGLGELVKSNQVILPRNGIAINVVLTPGYLPTGTGTDVFVLQIVFYQEINGIQYPLKNEEHNSMGII